MSVISRSARHHGVSLLEMVIALVVFSAVVFPVVTITTKVTGQVEQQKNSSVAKFEWTMFFSDFQKGVGLSYRFFPINQYKSAYGSNLALDANQQVFMAYMDQGEEKRMGYMFKPDNAGQAQLKFVELPANAYANQYIMTARDWKDASKVLKSEEYYFKSAVSPTSPAYAPKFVYCVGNMCGTYKNANGTSTGVTIQAQDADGIRIQAGPPDSPNKIKIVYNGSEIDMEPLYVKLSGLQFNQAASRYQMEPFPMDLSAWNTASDWVGERYDTSVTPAVLKPVGTQGEADLAKAASSNYYALPLNDMHYNTYTGELFAATNSTFTTSPVKRQFYIFRFAPGKADTPRYKLQYNGTTYEDPFPVVIKEGDAAYINENAQYLSVTQDRSGNIFVLAQDGSSYWVQKFSPSGGFISEFKLDSALSGAYGITFSGLPGNDQNIMVLANTGTSTSPNIRVRGYIKDQNGFDAATPTVDMALAPGLVTSSTLPVGFDYDMAHNHYVMVLSNMQVHTLSPIAIGSVAAGSSMGSFVLTPNSANSRCFDSQGIAYDSTRNMVYVSTRNPSSLPSGCANVGLGYRRVIPPLLMNPTSS